jgi:hypothetical protein
LDDKKMEIGRFLKGLSHDALIGMTVILNASSQQSPLKNLQISTFVVSSHDASIGMTVILNAPSQQSPLKNLQISIFAVSSHDA